MEILVLEDNLDRIRFFIEILGKYKLSVVDKAEEAVELLESKVFDMIFLDNDLGDGGYGADVAAYLANNPSNLNNDANIVVHCLDEQARIAMLKELTPNCPKTIGVYFGESLFHYLGLTNDEE